MRVLVACEESQRVCSAFRARGHEAYSCDIVECSGGHPEWHICEDVLPLINGNCDFRTMDGEWHLIDGKWDILIAHPPCTFLSNAGAARLYKRIEGKSYIERTRLEKGMDGKEFFMRFLEADCDRICVENPVPSAVFRLPEKSQVIQPYEYGHPYTKKNVSVAKRTSPSATHQCGDPERRLHLRERRDLEATSSSRRSNRQGEISPAQKQNLRGHRRGNGRSVGWVRS